MKRDYCGKKASSARRAMLASLVWPHSGAVHGFVSPLAPLRQPLGLLPRQISRAGPPLPGSLGGARHELAALSPPSALLADGLSAATFVNNSGGASAALSDTLSGLRLFFIVVAAAVFGLTGLAYLTAAILVPKAAEQLERDTKRLRPGLWEEYQAKLNEGEQMVDRPDLLQELGNLMQPVIVENYEREARGPDVVNGSAPSPPRSDRVLDVPVEKNQDGGAP